MDKKSAFQYLTSELFDDPCKRIYSDLYHMKM
jgi:hypothetical protein